MDKILKLLEIAKKFGVKPSKVIGTQGNVVPLKKPSLVEVKFESGSYVQFKLDTYNLKEYLYKKSVGCEWLTRTFYVLVVQWKRTCGYEPQDGSSNLSEDTTKCPFRIMEVQHSSKVSGRSSNL